ncbi:GNAT family N-acetyltransferase [Shewanella basaltis]|uniref:GNAT family N-acetyltransferase n=1 Tax=Shewanella basaltis TaxID=472183 RepID=UPI00200D9D4E|nr:GNAT family N-acetyltransferase [Shewanella basaltis]MCL1113035.1 GNAT family N-acetyltransferase [Shewanella basaltis]
MKAAVYQFRFVNTISEIKKSDWNAFFGISHPFTRHEYLSALELSHCVSPNTGWQPQHLVVSQGDTLIGLMPMYIKTHSWGEYVFDWAWAEAFERNQLEYYPKIVTSIPFTPTTGQRIGFAPFLSENEKQDVINQVGQFIRQQLVDRHWSSWHGLFNLQSQHNMWLNSSVISRLGCQFHWHNHGYSDFNDFLGNMSSRKRKNILKERAQIQQAQLRFTFVEGNKASPEQWQGFVQCYQRTYLKRSGHQGYLSADFFLLVAATMGESIRLLLVENSQNQLVASALYFISDSHLYGRYWGALTEYDGLHFEACYYQGIEYAIANQLSVFDAGAQGEHKVARGFYPVLTYSSHIIQHQGFGDAIADFCEQEQHHIGLYMQQMTAQLPYKTTCQ